MEINTIDQYIRQFDETTQGMLQELRQLISSAEPAMTEKISWAMPTFCRRHNIIHFAAFKQHIGLYPGADAIIYFQERLKPYQTSKGAIRLPYNQPFDRQLIIDLVKYNLQNEV